MAHWRIVLWLLLVLPALVARGEETLPVYVGLDGEFGLLNSTSAQAIEHGMLVALDEINAAGGVLGGRSLALLTRDNRSVPARGVENIRDFARVRELVAVFGGRFSPVIMEEVPVLHELGLPLLDPWGSADGITAHKYHPSYTFRLSLRDSDAIPALLKFAAGERGARRVGLLLPNTAWGRSNLQAMQRYQARESVPAIVDPVWYNWGEHDMLRHYRALREEGAEAIILVANDIEGSLLVRQLADAAPEELVPIISHWGVTGGRMVENSGEMLHKLDFTVLQTFSLFTADPERRDSVMAVARRLFGVRSIEQVESPVGFGQAYDLLHILARAINLAGTTDRAAIRTALEQVSDYQGLTGDYPAPFTAERHDAIRPEQLFMARYRRDGVLVPLSVSGSDP